ncbi:hypothetical protein EDC94DRAFT_662621 [Helicostylum pulchrum]|nr:hypothetical protein EDC94DRAFT_662621 [Helicostylum pulchrum]
MNILLLSTTSGETKLDASKEEENLAKNDDEKRSAGSSIDCIIRAGNLNLDLLLVEVSGPMWKEDYIHFLKDRLEIAKNLRKISKSMFRKSFVLGRLGSSESDKVKKNVGTEATVWRNVSIGHEMIREVE